MLPKPPLPPQPTATTSRGLLDIVPGLHGCPSLGTSSWVSVQSRTRMPLCMGAKLSMPICCLLLPFDVLSVFSLESATRLLENASLDNSNSFGRAAAVFCRLRFRLKWPTNWLSFLMEVTVAGRWHPWCKALSPCRIRSTIHVSCLGDETRRPSIPSTWLWKTSLRTGLAPSRGQSLCATFFHAWSWLCTWNFGIVLSVGSTSSCCFPTRGTFGHVSNFSAMHHECMIATQIVCFASGRATGFHMERICVLIARSNAGFPPSHKRYSYTCLLLSSC